MSLLVSHGTKWSKEVEFEFNDQFLNHWTTTLAHQIISFNGPSFSSQKLTWIQRYRCQAGGLHINLAYFTRVLSTGDKKGPGLSLGFSDLRNIKQVCSISADMWTKFYRNVILISIPHLQRCVLHYIFPVSNYFIAK